jgi:hypothetical protein
MGFDDIRYGCRFKTLIAFKRQPQKEGKQGADSDGK